MFIRSVPSLVIVEQAWTILRLLICMYLNYIWHEVDTNSWLRPFETWGCGSFQTLWSLWTTGNYYSEISSHGFPMYFNHQWRHTKGAAPRFVIRSNVYSYRTQRGLASRNQIRFPLCEWHQSAPLGTRHVLSVLPLCTVEHNSLSCHLSGLGFGSSR